MVMAFSGFLFACVGHICKYSVKDAIRHLFPQMTNCPLTPIIAPAVECLQVYSGHHQHWTVSGTTVIYRKKGCQGPLIILLLIFGASRRKFLKSFPGMFTLSSPSNCVTQSLGMGTCAQCCCLVPWFCKEENPALYSPRGFVAQERFPPCLLAFIDSLGSSFWVYLGKKVKLQSNCENWLPGLFSGMSLDMHLEI